MMEPELEQHLQRTSKEQLIALLQELATRHPVLLTEMISILEHSSTAEYETEDESEEDIGQDWDFVGDKPPMVHTFPRSTLSEEDDDGRRFHIEEYRTRLKQEHAPQSVARIALQLIEEADLYTEQQQYAYALDLYALLLDERLLLSDTAITSALDDVIDEAMPVMEEVLCDTSSATIIDTATAPLSPLLTANIRHRWLERLFALWLKRLDAHRQEEDIPDIMLNMIWSEDMLLVRSLVQNELQSQPRNEHSNIVDFAHQYRTRALEKFLKELKEFPYP